ESDWSRYRHVTDSGIASELLRRHGRHDREIEEIRRRFVELIADALTADPARCCEVPGAAAFLCRLRQIPNLAIGLATGGWEASAKLKLHHAGIDADGLAFASADDAVARTDIMKACHKQVASRGALITETIYIGDGLWDAKAASVLRWFFIGI